MDTLKYKLCVRDLVQASPGRKPKSDKSILALLLRLSSARGSLLVLLQSNQIKMCMCAINQQNSQCRKSSYDTCRTEEGISSVPVECPQFQIQDQSGSGRPSSPLFSDYWTHKAIIPKEHSNNIRTGAPSAKNEDL